MSRHVIWNPPYLRPKNKRDNTERSIDHGSSFCDLVERLSLFRSWRSKKKWKLILMLHCYDCWFNAYIVQQVLDLLLWLLIQCFYYGTGVGSYNMVVYSMPILWSRYWFLYYVCSLNICIMGQILVPILFFWLNVYIMKQILILILYLLAQFLYYGLLTQCLYYEADTGSYGMVVRSMFVLWGRNWFLNCSLNICIMVRYWFLYCVFFWLNAYIVK
jgi:hypothetical protein